MKGLTIWMLGLALSWSVSLKAQTDIKMDQFISDLMGMMTVEEKIGQLNLVTGGEAVTGSVVSTGVEAKIKAGEIGGIFSMSSPARIRAAQELAVKHSRLGIRSEEHTSELQSREN